MEGKGSAASMRDSALPYSRRSLAAHEQVKRRGLSAFGSGRLSPLLAATVFVAVFFLVPAPCSAFPVLPVPGRLDAEANREATNYYFVSLRHPSKTEQSNTAPPCTPPPVWPTPSAPLSAKSHKNTCRKRPPAPAPSPTPPPSPPFTPPPRPPPPSPQTVPRNQNMLVSTMGWSFLGIALLLQVALGGFLVYRRRELQRSGPWLD